MRLLSIVFSLGVFLLSINVSSQENSALIEPSIPKNHRLVFNQVQDEASVKWVVSSIKKVNGRWRYEESAEVVGQLLKQTYEFHDVDRDDLVISLQRLADKSEWRELYSCEGLACGRSYGWAEVLENKMLHGTDSTQQYWVWQGEGVWYSAFLVERRNRRVYLQWSELSLQDVNPMDGNAKNILKVWDTQGFAVLPVAPFAVSESNAIAGDGNPRPLVDSADFALLLHWLGGLTERKFAVVGHNQVEQQKDQELKSLREAQVLQRALKQAFNNYEFEVYGLGPIAPRGDWEQRVEVVPLPR